MKKKRHLEKNLGELKQKNAKLRAELDVVEKKRDKLEHEKRCLEAHNNLVNAINEFHHRARNYIAVRLNLINETMRKHPELPAVWDDWRNTELSLWAAKHGKGDTDTGEEADSFAVHTVKYEMESRKTTVADAVKDIAGAAFVLRQLHEYRKAYLRRHILFLKKECPDLEHQDSEMQEIAWAGFQLRQGVVDDPEVVKWVTRIAELEKSARTLPHLLSDPAKASIRNLAQCFHRALVGSKAKWKQPSLDGWLLLVWPLVQIEKWNYQTVHNLACLKFPNFADGDVLSQPRIAEGFDPADGEKLVRPAGEKQWKPLRSVDAMSDHCKKDLRLAISNPKGGKPKHDQFNFGNPSPLHRFALQIGDSFPEFSTFQKTK